MNATAFSTLEEVLRSLYKACSVEPGLPGGTRSSRAHWKLPTRPSLRPHRKKIAS